jgi:hypothetical protein
MKRLDELARAQMEDKRLAEERMPSP